MVGAAPTTGGVGGGAVGGALVGGPKPNKFGSLSHGGTNLGRSGARVKNEALVAPCASKFEADKRAGP